MHRRARHLNAKAAGAVVHLDARIPGAVYADAAEVTTWTDRAGLSSPTQGTSTKRPLFYSGIQAGNPALLFDKADDGLVYTTTNRLFGGHFIFAAKHNSATFTGYNGPVEGAASAAFAGNSGGTGWYNFGCTGLRKNGVAYSIGASGAGPMNSWGVCEYTAPTVVSTTLRVGSQGGTANRSWDGYLGSVIGFPAALGNSMRNRIAHSLAFTWKIPCS